MQRFGGRCRLVGSGQIEQFEGRRRVVVVDGLTLHARQALAAVAHRRRWRRRQRHDSQRRRRPFKMIAVERFDAGAGRNGRRRFNDANIKMVGRGVVSDAGIDVRRRFRPIATGAEALAVDLRTFALVARRERRSGTGAGRRSATSCAFGAHHLENVGAPSASRLDQRRRPAGHHLGRPAAPAGRFHAAGAHCDAMHYDGAEFRRRRRYRRRIDVARIRSRRRSVVIVDRRLPRRRF